MSESGLIMLFDRAGGKLTKKMRDVVAKVEVNSQHAKNLIADMHTTLATSNLQNDVKSDCLQFDTFYNGFMAPYFGCFQCDDTKHTLQAIGMDKDCLVDWNELLVYLKWVITQYLDIKDTDELLFAKVLFQQCVMRSSNQAHLRVLHLGGSGGITPQKIF